LENYAPRILAQARASNFRFAFSWHSLSPTSPPPLPLFAVNRAIPPNVAKLRIVILFNVAHLLADVTPDFVKLQTLAIKAAHLGI
jgi:hypothetical protein